ncbi:MAG: ABC transporter permease [Bacteroides sp.]
MANKNISTGLFACCKREFHRLYSRPLYLFCMVIAPLFCVFFFTTLMSEGLPNQLPVAAVDLDRTSTSRKLLRTLNSFQQTKIVAEFNSIEGARKAMQRGEVYGFFYLPKRVSRDAQNQQQPKISFYTNNSFLIAGSLLFKDMKTMGELASGSAARSVLYAKGATEEQAMVILRPISIDTHPLNNPWLNYSVYLSNTIIPGILSLMILMVTVFSIGVEIKEESARQWLRVGDKSIFTSLLGKLLPQALIWLTIGLFILIYLYGYLSYPCNSGIFPMIIAIVALILASQGLGVFMIGVIPSLRLALSSASLWGVLAFSITGFSFPVMAMHPTLQALSNLFPLRHYFLIYVNQALNGYAMSYAWTNYLALLIFMILPLFILKRLQYALVYYKHMS